MAWRMLMLVAAVCAFGFAGCSGPDAPKKPTGPTTQLPVEQDARNA